MQLSKVHHFTIKRIDKITAILTYKAKQNQNNFSLLFLAFGCSLLIAWFIINLKTYSVILSILGNRLKH